MSNAEVASAQEPIRRFLEQRAGAEIRALAPYHRRWLDAAQRQGLSLARGAQGRQGARCRLRLWRYRDPACPPGRADRLGARHRLLRGFPGIRPPGRQGRRPRAMSASWKRTCRPIRSSRYDFCFSRFGTQFFENPVAGLRNMRKSLKPGGIMTMIVWRGINDNPWLGHRQADRAAISCRRPARTRRPAGRDRSPWPTPAW